MNIFQVVLFKNMFVSFYLFCLVEHLCIFSDWLVVQPWRSSDSIQLAIFLGCWHDTLTDYLKDDIRYILVGRASSKTSKPDLSDLLAIEMPWCWLATCLKHCQAAMTIERLWKSGEESRVFQCNLRSERNGWWYPSFDMLSCWSLELAPMLRADDFIWVLPILSINN